MAWFRKRPVVVEAAQLRRDTWGEVCYLMPVGGLKDGNAQFCYVHRDENGNPSGHEGDDGRGEIGLWIPTLEGLVLGCENDWIIRGVNGEFYPCNPDVFEMTYEPVEGPRDESSYDPVEG